jgi:ribosomal protein S18 acetylase RimI-like enzyme
MDAVEIRTATAADREALFQTLLLAFSTDPCVRYAFATPQGFMAGFPAFSMGMGGGALEHDAAFVTADLDAAALWLPPGVESDGEAIGAAIGELPVEKQMVLGQVVEQMSQFHPQEPHGYLAMVGADPARQGRGLGSALIKHGLRQVDAQGLPAYLESSHPRNVPLYERHGFEVMGVIQPDDFPPLIPMLRPARS